MYKIGKPEIDAVAKVIRSGRLFRYMKNSQCERFEKRWAGYLGVKHAHMTSSGTTALTAALTGLGIGPGDEVIVPACTYMASAVSVLAVGAIPVIVDIDESATIDPDAVADAAGRYTRAIIPVHMWGMSCAMDAIMRVARRKKLLVVEDACQSVGGGYHGRKLGAIGHVGAFSFNYFKNLTCGEGGAVVTSDDKVYARARCAVDCCGFYWTGEAGDVVGFTASGARASEFEGAIMNVQLGRLPGMLAAMRRQKKRIMRATADLAPLGFRAAPCHSPDDESGTHNVWLLPSARHAEQFQKLTGATILGRTGRHIYRNWDPILARHGGPHPAMDPFKHPRNRRCRKNYRKDQFPRSLDILNRSVSIGNHPDHTAAQINALIARIRSAAGHTLDSHRAL